MTRDITEASEALFSMITEAEPRLRTLRPWYRKLVTTIDKWYSSEGNQGVSRAKDILHEAWQQVLFGKSTPLDFVKSTGGIPDLVMPMVKYIKTLPKSAKLLSLVLSLVRVTDLWSANKDEASVLQSIDKIVSPRLPASAKKVIEEFQQFLDVILSTPAYDKVPFVRALRNLIPVDESVYFYKSNKAGPNGPLMENAHLDLVTLRHCKTSKGTLLVDEIGYLRRKVFEYQSTPRGGNRWLEMPAFDGNRPQTLAAFSDQELLKGLPEGKSLSGCPGKLALKLEKSGKIRIIAMPDYYTQASMKPIGQWLRNVLKAFPGDCTFDQDAAIPKIIAWQSEGRTMYSCDQSSCTDLFPVRFQTCVLEKCFDKQLAEAVQTVLTDREWEITLPKSLVTRKVKWPVGQPLGVYSSWPLMAVAHHLLVQFASWRSTSDKSRWGPFNDYVICGDDIVIASVSVAQNYLRLARLLGMKINQSKSYISGGNTKRDASSEFAKRFVWKSNLLYPIKPRLVLSAIQDWRLAVTLLWQLHENYSVTTSSLRKLIHKYFISGSRYLDNLLTVPRVLGGCGLRSNTSFRAGASQIIKTGTEIHPWLYYLAVRIRSKLLGRRPSKVINEQARRDPSFALLGSDAYRVHPAVESYYWDSEEYHESAHLNRPVPDLDDLIVDIVVNGWDSWKQDLEQVIPGPMPPGFDWETVERKVENTWRRVFDKPKHIDVLTSLDSLMSLDQLIGSLGEMVETDPIGLPVELQVTRVGEALDILRAATERNSG